jgi:putative transposase
MSRNNRRRWIAPWKNSVEKPEIYHAVGRVVGRGFLLGEEEREHFRMLMRMCEKFTGCRVLTYCLMSNHFHILLEVTPVPEGGISDGVLFGRLGVFYGEAQVAAIAREMEEAAGVRERGEFELPPVDESGVPLTREDELARARGEAAARVEEIRQRYTRRMHDLSWFMKSLLERFTKWFNGKHSRSGTLWEDRFKSVIVESGVAARTIAAYIDLNPVRAGMVSDPADYRWSGYGEAVGGGKKGNGKKSREGIVRACMSHKGAGFEAEKWKEVSRIYRRALGMALGRKNTQTQDLETQDTRKEDETRGMNDAEYLEAGAYRCQTLPELSMAKMLRCRVRYFTDGAVIGSKAFVNEVFVGARERFTERRKDGARRMRGSGAGAKGVLWSMRDLRVGV